MLSMMRINAQKPPHANVEFVRICMQTDKIAFQKPCRQRGVLNRLLARERRWSKGASLVAGKILTVQMAGAYIEPSLQKFSKVLQSFSRVSPEFSSFSNVPGFLTVIEIPGLPSRSSTT